jgi:hypothetical protein
MFCHFYSPLAMTTYPTMALPLRGDVAAETCHWEQRRWYQQLVTIQKSYVNEMYNVVPLSYKLVYNPH